MGSAGPPATRGSRFAGGQARRRPPPAPASAWPRRRCHAGQREIAPASATCSFLAVHGRSWGQPFLSFLPTAFPLPVDDRSGSRGWSVAEGVCEWNLAMVAAPIRDHPDRGWPSDPLPHVACDMGFGPASASPSTGPPAPARPPDTIASARSAPRSLTGAQHQKTQRQPATAPGAVPAGRPAGIPRTNGVAGWVGADRVLPEVWGCTAGVIARADERVQRRYRLHHGIAARCKGSGNAPARASRAIICLWPGGPTMALSLSLRRRAAWRHWMADSGALPHDTPISLGGRSPMADPCGGGFSGGSHVRARCPAGDKLHAMPRPPPGFVPRQRLVEALGEGLVRGRVLVGAPAGIRQDRALCDWARGGGRPVAWLGMDDGDSDPARFWRYAVTLRTGPAGAGWAGKPAARAAAPAVV